MRTRAALVLVGIAAGVYGAVLLLDLGWDNLVQTVIWMAAAVVVHDGLLGMALVAAGVVVAGVVPDRLRAPIAAGLVVLGTVTATAIPALTRMGARADNATLLDRHYVVGWLVFTVLVVIATVVRVVRAAARPES